MPYKSPDTVKPLLTFLNSSRLSPDTSNTSLETIFPTLIHSIRRHHFDIRTRPASEGIDITVVIIKPTVWSHCGSGSYRVHSNQLIRSQAPPPIGIKSFSSTLFRRSFTNKIMNMLHAVSATFECVNESVPVQIIRPQPICDPRKCAHSYKHMSDTISVNHRYSGY